MDLTTFKNISDIAQAFATISAIFVGGVWTYILFVGQRQKYPRADIKHSITQKHIANNKLLLHVAVSISNTGNVLLSLISGETRIQQLQPLSGDLLGPINRGEDPVMEGQTEILWPLISSRKSEWKEDEFEIEPGESDWIHYDFILDANIHTIQIYSYFKNVKKRHSEIGWPLTTIYDVLPQ